MTSTTSFVALRMSTVLVEDSIGKPATRPFPANWSDPFSRECNLWCSATADGSGDGCRGRIPDDEFGWEFDGSRNALGVRDQVHEALRRDLAHVSHRLTHCGEGGRQIARLWDIVEADK